MVFNGKKNENKTFVPGWAWTTNLSVTNYVVTAERANRLRHGDKLIDLFGFKLGNWK